MEDLDGSGEPSLWRLLDVISDAKDTTHDAGNGQATTEVASHAAAAIEAVDETLERTSSHDPSDKTHAAALAAPSAAAQLSTNEHSTLAPSYAERTPSSGDAPETSLSETAQREAQHLPNGLEVSTCPSESTASAEASVLASSSASAGLPSGTPQIEQWTSLNMLRNLLPERNHDVASFHTPPGWVEEPDLADRRVKMTWAQRDACGALVRRFDKRSEVEEICEFEAAARGEAWLGQIVGGRWEIRAKAMVGLLAPAHVPWTHNTSDACACALSLQSGGIRTPRPTYAALSQVCPSYLSSPLLIDACNRARTQAAGGDQCPVRLATRAHRKDADHVHGGQPLLFRGAICPPAAWHQAAARRGRGGGTLCCQSYACAMGACAIAVPRCMLLPIR